METEEKPDFPFDVEVARQEATRRRQPATEMFPAGEQGSSRDVHAILIHDEARGQVTKTNQSDQCGGLIDTDEDI